MTRKWKVAVGFVLFCMATWLFAAQWKQLNNLILTGDLAFEGATANAFETKLTVTDPTADRTVTLPNATGTVHQSGTTSATFGAGTDVDIPITFDQGTGTDPIFVWDDSAAAFEFDFDGVLADGLDPFVNTSSVGVPISIIAEGSTADAFETTLTFTDPAADATVTVPDVTGTILLATGVDTHGVFAWGDSSDAFDLGDEVCAALDLTCVDAYTITGGASTCSTDQGTATTHFFALCK